jgi:hypothetical protein
MLTGLSQCGGVALLLAAGVSFEGCGGGGAAIGPPPPPPPPSIVVNVTPQSNLLLLGNTQVFAADVANTTNTAVTWSVNGVIGGNGTVGTISAAGVYTAPADLPNNTVVTVAATSAADPSKTGSAQVTLASDIAVSVTPGAANVELGSVQKLQGGLASSGHPDNTILWSLSGASCPAACGTIDANGNYTAPQILPPSPNVVVRAQSAADQSKFATATLTIASSFTLQLSGPPNIAANTSTTIVATLTPVPNSNPTPNLSWSLSGNGCNGNSCGTLATTTTQFDASNVEVSSASYVAPAAAPSPNSVTITVTPTADPSKKAQLTIQIQVGPSIAVSPGTATVAANHRVTLAAQITGTSNTTVNWSVNGVLGGNATVGTICAVGSNPCNGITGGTLLPVDYVAPGAIPSPNPVTVTATSAADARLQASSQITVINHVIVSVEPGNVALAPLAVQGFAASVLGTSNQSVTWQVQGSGCAGVGGCGTITPAGAYTAPGAAPSPDAIQILAISADDTSQSGVANVTISTGADILTLHPASVYAGEANGFTLRVDGSGFATTSTGAGSTLLIGGMARTTTCPSSNECTAVVTASDTQTAGSVTVQVQNPNGQKSNSVSLIVVAPGTGVATTALSTASPAATGIDITVVEPTTAGVSQPASDVDLNIAALGSFHTANNSCNLGGNPVTVTRPASGAATADICVFSQSGLDTSMTYTISGSGDVSVIAKQPAGLGIIHLTLQVTSAAQAGARTLFIQNTNLDETAASGVLEVQ